MNYLHLANRPIKCTGLKSTMTLKPGLGVTQGHWEWNRPNSQSWSADKTRVKNVYVLNTHSPLLLEWVDRPRLFWCWLVSLQNLVSPVGSVLVPVQVLQKMCALGARPCCRGKLIVWQYWVVVLDLITFKSSGWSVHSPPPSHLDDDPWFYTRITPLVFEFILFDVATTTVELLVICRWISTVTCRLRLNCRPTAATSLFRSATN